jgi:hypothetical protein
MPAKADKLTVEQRTEAVYRLILDGWTQEQICQNMSKSFRVSDRQVYRYIDAAWERIKAVNEVELSEHKRRAVAAHYQMLREAKTVKEKATVWAALSRLLGLDAPKAVEVAGRNGGAIVIRNDPMDEVSNDEAQRRLGALARGALAVIEGIGNRPVAGDAAGVADDDSTGAE